MEMAEYIVSKKNKPKITRNGNLFVFDKQSKKDPIIKFWRCERKNNCKAGIQTKDDVVITEIYVHSRGASATSVEIATFKTSLSAKMITPQCFVPIFLLDILHLHRCPVRQLTIRTSLLIALV